jgi:hypothetical protein
MLDEVPRGTQETGPTFAGQTGGASPKRKPRVVGIVALGSIIGYSLPHRWMSCWTFWSGSRS